MNEVAPGSIGTKTNGMESATQLCFVLGVPG